MKLGLIFSTAQTLHSRDKTLLNSYLISHNLSVVLIQQSQNIVAFYCSYPISPTDVVKPYQNHKTDTSSISRYKSNIQANDTQLLYTASNFHCCLPFRLKSCKQSIQGIQLSASVTILTKGASTTLFTMSCGFDIL